MVSMQGGGECGPSQRREIFMRCRVAPTMNQSNIAPGRSTKLDMQRRKSIEDRLQGLLRYKYLLIATDPNISCLPPLGHPRTKLSTSAPQSQGTMERNFNSKSLDAGYWANVGVDDTVLISQMSSQTHLSQDLNAGVSQMSMNDLGDKGRIDASQGKKKRNGPRELVDEEHLAILISAYNVHFEKYSEGRRQVTQLIPSVVWKGAYATYLDHYPNSVFKQESLKDRLRESLKEIKTGISNDDNSQKAALQSKSVLETLKCTDGYAKRNILRKRQTILKATTVNLSSSSEGSGENEPFYTPPTTLPNTGIPPSTPCKGKNEGKENQPISPCKGKKKCKESLPMTKAQMLCKQSNAIERLCYTFERGSVKRDALVDLKINSTSEKHKKQRMDNLKQAWEFGVITDSEFKASAEEEETIWRILRDQLLDVALKTFVDPGDHTNQPLPYFELDIFLEPWRLTIGVPPSG